MVHVRTYYSTYSIYVQYSLSTTCTTDIHCIYYIIDPDYGRLGCIKTMHLKMVKGWRIGTESCEKALSKKDILQKHLEQGKS